MDHGVELAPARHLPAPIAPALFVIPRPWRGGSVVFEPEADAKGERMVWIEAAVVDRLATMRGPGESYSDVILRLVEL